MIFFYNPEPIDKTISELKRKFRTMMNGEVAESMNRKGADYRVNYGVEYLRLKRLATKYESNSDLANRLWKLHIRETMILATLLQPAEKYTFYDAEEWIKSIQQPELVEYWSMNLLAKVDFANLLITKWIQTDELWKQITAFTLSARICQQLDTKLIDLLIQRAKDLSKTENFHLYKSLALSLSRMCRSEQYANRIIKEIETFEHSNFISQKYIFDEVKTEISFFDF